MQVVKPGDLWALACESVEDFWPAARTTLAETRLPWLLGTLHGHHAEEQAEREAAAFKRAAVAIQGVVLVRAHLDPRGGLDGHDVYLDYLDEVIELA